MISPERIDVDGRIEQVSGHLLCRLAVNVSDLNAAFEKTLVGLPSELVSLVLGDNDVQGAFDCFRLGFGVQNFLCA